MFQGDPQTRAAELHHKLTPFNMQRIATPRYVEGCAALGLDDSVSDLADPAGPECVRFRW
jgi:hypothetical protein